MSNDFEVDNLYAALDRKRQSLSLSWSSVAKEIEARYTKVSSSTIKGIREKSFVEGDGALQMLLWLGRSPESFVPGVRASERHRLEEPTNGVLRFDVQRTYRLLESKRIEEGLAWDQVADYIGGVSVSMLERFEKGGRTSFPAIARIARWLNVRDCPGRC